MKRFALLLVISGLLALPASGCKGTCDDLLKKYVQCEGEGKGGKKGFEKRKKKFLESCKKDLKDEDFGSLQKKVIACSKKGSCGKFKDCVSAAYEGAKDLMKKKWEKEAKQRAVKQLKQERTEIEKHVADKDVKKALEKCTWAFNAKSALKEGNDEAKKLARGFYDFCLGEMPKWVASLGQSGTREYVSVCSKSSSKTYFEESAASDAQQQAIGAACEVLKASQTLTELKKRKDEVKYGLPWECKGKDFDAIVAAASPEGKKIAADLLRLCFIDVGVKYLQEQSKQSFKYCSSSSKDILKGIAKHQLAKPEHQAVIDLWTAECSKGQ